MWVAVVPNQIEGGVWQYMSGEGRTGALSFACQVPSFAGGHSVFRNGFRAYTLRQVTLLGSFVPCIADTEYLHHLIFQDWVTHIAQLGSFLVSIARCAHAVTSIVYNDNCTWWITTAPCIMRLVSELVMTPKTVSLCSLGLCCRNSRFWPRVARVICRPVH